MKLILKKLLLHQAANKTIKSAFHLLISVVLKNVEAVSRHK
jgi:hypothetical protein